MRHIFYFPHMECEESLRVLILSHLYPNTMNPVRGIFVHEQVQELIRQGCEVRVVSPVPWSPIPLSWLLDNYRSLARIPHKALWYGVEVRYPRYRLFPRGYFLNIPVGFIIWGQESRQGDPPGIFVRYHPRSHRSSRRVWCILAEQSLWKALCCHHSRP